MDLNHEKNKIELNDEKDNFNDGCINRWSDVC